MRRLITAGLTVLVSVFGLLGWTFAQEASPVVSPRALRIAEQEVVRLDLAQSFGISPDGRWLAVVRGPAGRAEAVCAFAAATLAEHRCAPFAGGPVQGYRVQWSPDGTRLAFTEDAEFRLEDADIWVFDIATGALTNLTDDGYAGSQDDAPDGIGVDFAPVWSPDGTEIAFARSVTRGDGSGRSALFRVSITGGEPREVVEAAAQPFAVMAGLRWLADGTILYSVSDRDGDPANGLWSVAAGGGGARQVVSESASGLVLPVLTAVSPQGRALLAGGGPRAAFALVNLATGQAERLEPVGEGATAVAAATLSPDGTRLLVSELHEAGDREQHLVVHDLETGEWQELGTLDWLIGAIQRQGGLIWASNDLVFGTGGALTGLLVRLASG